MSSPFQLFSAGFNAGDAIPARHTCDGEDVSPPLSWGGVPDGARSLALIVDDPDAPQGTFVHWVVYNIPPDYNGRTFTEGASFDEESAIMEGRNDFGRQGYGGPCPPPESEHTYGFRMYALDAELDLEEGAMKKQVTQAMEGHILDEANISGTYRRAG